MNVGSKVECLGPAGHVMVVVSSSSDSFRLLVPSINSGLGMGVDDEVPNSQVMLGLVAAFGRSNNFNE